MNNTTFRFPEPAQWQQVNELLDELLDLDPALRDVRLQELVETDPGLAPMVQRLVECASDERGLDRALGSAFDFVLRGDPLPVPPRLGPWRLRDAIGEGGMGRVYLAERKYDSFVQRAAIKLMRTDPATPSSREGFSRERRILGSLRDGRIARLLDGGETEDGNVWLAMEYIDGIPIDEYCRRHDLSLENRLELLDEVIGAVEHAHQQLVIHRDIKPGNVLVTGDGQVRLLDFGIAKLLDGEADAPSDQTLTRALTPRYASPEQLAGQPVTTASDTYQLGLLMFELITGQCPSRDLPRASDALHECLHQAGLPGREIRRRVQQVRGDLDHIIARATAEDPRDRYPSCDRLRTDLRYHRDGWPITARANDGWYRTRRFMRRHSVAVGMTSVALLAGSLYLTTALHQARAIHAEAAKASAVRDFMFEIFRQADPGHNLGQELPVRVVLEQGHRQIDQALHEQPAIRGELLHTLGELYRALGEYRPAEELLRAAIGVAADEGDRKAEFRSRIALAEILGIDGHQYQAAEDEARSALALAYTVRERALANAEIGYLLLKRGRPEDAEPILRASLASYLEQGREKVLPMELARIRTYMAYTDLVLGNLDRSERDLRSVRDTYVQRLGPDHPEVQGVSYSLARISEIRGDWARAEREIRRVVAAETRVLGAGHSEVAISRTRLGHILFAQGRLEDAEREFSESLEIFEQTADSPHYFLADNLKGHAELELARGHVQQAGAYLERALGMLEQILEWPDWRLADAYRVSAALAVAAGNCAEARPLLERAREPMLARPEPYPSRWRAAWDGLQAAAQSGCR